MPLCPHHWWLKGAAHLGVDRPLHGWVFHRSEDAGTVESHKAKGVPYSFRCSTTNLKGIIARSTRPPLQSAYPFNRCGRRSPIAFRMVFATTRCVTETSPGGRSEDAITQDLRHWIVSDLSAPLLENIRHGRRMPSLKRALRR